MVYRGIGAWLVSASGIPPPEPTGSVMEGKMRVVIEEQAQKGEVSRSLRHTQEGDGTTYEGEAGERAGSFSRAWNPSFRR